ncbi:hypothetical protein ACFL5K_03050 [Gemmatimonadota bacterium]
MRTGILFPAVLILLLIAAGYKGRLNAQQSYPAPGLVVGDKIPDFSLPDQNGKMQDFESMAGPNGLIILFHRSADW